MTATHCRATIVSMAIIASAAATLLHEGAGHGLTAWLRGDIVTELTSNHLSSIRPDKWVDAAGTLVNLAVGTLSLLAMRAAGNRPATRYFLWLFAALNLLPGAGYFLFSGIIGVGDWQQVIQDLPLYPVCRIAMAIFGLVLYIFVVRTLGRAAYPFVGQQKDYNTIGRLPYLAAGLFSTLAGAFDPLGLKLLFISTIPAEFGGSSGLLWADSFLPKTKNLAPLYVPRLASWWVAAAIIGGAYIFFLGRGIHFTH